MNIVYLSLDERPCNYDYPQALASMTNLTLQVPSKSILGQKKKAGDAIAIKNWLEEKCQHAQYALVSIDMLLYGGIVPSRLHDHSVELLYSRMETLRTIKKNNPSLKLYAFHLITRAPAYSSSEEEPDYYAYYGKELNEYGWLQDKFERNALDEHEEKRMLELKVSIPSHIFSDFINRRLTNKKLNELSITLVKEGIIDYLVIPLDDNAQYGYTSSEQRNLVHIVQQYNLLDKIAIYPGADEIGCTMFSKIFCEVNQFSPLIHINYSSTLGPTIIPKYEDRSLNESIKHHITASGAYIAQNFEEPDIYLMVHSPATSGKNVAETSDESKSYHPSYFSEVNIREFVHAISRLTTINKVVALADVALCNGGDHLLMNFLSKKGIIDKIDSYAAWNTSGNSLGTVVSHAIITAFNKKYNPNDDYKYEMSRIFYFYRLIEDWGYQSLVRQDITVQDLPLLNASYFNLAHVQEEVENLIEHKLNNFIREYLPNQETLQISELYLPWQRMFEVGFKLIK